MLNDNIADWGDAWEHFPGDVAYVWHAGIMADIVAASLKKKGFSLRSQIIWAKNQLVIGRGNYHPMHVAPLTGAWIETSLLGGLMLFSGVAPLTGAWIETL